MQRTFKESSFTFTIVGCSIIQLLAAISTVHQTGKCAATAGLGITLSLPTDDLPLLKDVQIYDCFVCAVENSLLLIRIIPLLLIPDRVYVSLEIACATCVLSAFQNCHHGSTIPSARIFGTGLGLFLPWLTVYAVGVNTPSSFN